MKKNGASIVIFIISTFLLLYIVIRAFSVAITYDEAWSYLNVQSFFESQLSLLELLENSNTHLLPSLYLAFCHFLPGDSVFLLRVSSILAFIMYLYFCFKIIDRLIPSTLFQVPCFILLTVNSYLLDFFSLIRGYGMALGFMMGSIYFLLVSVDEPISEKTNRNFLIATLFGMLSVFSVYVLIIYQLGLFAAFLIVSAFRQSKNHGILIFTLKNFPIKTIIINLLFLVPLTVFLFRLKAAGELYFGSTSGILQGTLHSITQCLLYGWNISWIENLFKAGVISLFIFLALLIFHSIFRHKEIHTYLVVYSLTAIVVICILSQHYLLSTRFPVNRAAIFLFPLTVLSLNGGCLYFCQYFSIPRIRCIAKSFVVGISVLGVIHFLDTANSRYFLEWKYTADIENVVKRILKTKTRNQDKPVVLAANVYFIQPLVYYAQKYNINWLYFSVIDNFWDYDYKRIDLPIAYYAQEQQIKTQLDKRELKEILYYNPDYLLLLEDYSTLVAKNLVNIEMINSYPTSGATLFQIQQK